MIAQAMKHASDYRPAAFVGAELADFTKLYVRDIGKKTPAPTLPPTGNTA
jgi:hypothetical protein